MVYGRKNRKKPNSVVKPWSSVTLQHGGNDGYANHNKAAFKTRGMQGAHFRRALHPLDGPETVEAKVIDNVPEHCRGRQNNGETPISTTERCISHAAVGARIAVAMPSKQTAWKIRSGNLRWSAS